MGLFGGILKRTIGNIFPKNTKVGQFLGSTRTAGSGVIGKVFEKKEAERVAAGLPYGKQIANKKDMGLFSGISGGVSFGKNQTIILALAGVIFAVALAATRGFGLFAGKKTKRR